MTTEKPATALPLKLAVFWDDERVTLFSTGNAPYDCSIAVSKDSVKGKLFEEIARRANAYPRLVEALRKVHAAVHPFDSIANRQAAGAVYDLLRELGEEA